MPTKFIITLLIIALLAACAPVPATATETPTALPTETPTKIPPLSRTLQGLTYQGYKVEQNDSGMYEISFDQNVIASASADELSYTINIDGRDVSARLFGLAKYDDLTMAGLVAVVEDDGKETIYFHDKNAQDKKTDFRPTVAGLLEKSGKFYHYDESSGIFTEVLSPEWADLTGLNISSSSDRGAKAFLSKEENGQMTNLYAVIEDKESGKWKVLSTRWDLLPQLSSEDEFVKKYIAGKGIRITSFDGKVYDFGGGGSGSAAIPDEDKVPEVIESVYPNFAQTIFSAELQQVYFPAKGGGFVVTVAVGGRYFEYSSTESEYISVVAPLAVERDSQFTTLFPLLSDIKPYVVDGGKQKNLAELQSSWSKFMVEGSNVVCAFGTYGGYDVKPEITLNKDEEVKALAEGYLAWIKSYRQGFEEVDELPTVGKQFIFALVESGYKYPGRTEIDRLKKVMASSPVVGELMDIFLVEAVLK